MFQYTNLQDAQQAALSFLLSQVTHLEREVNFAIYPEVQYPGLVPVDTSAGEWAKTVTYFSGDRYGEAKWINGNADDIRRATTSLEKHESQIHMAGIGYGYGLDELMQARMAGVNLQAEDAIAARLAAEQFIDGVVLRGDSTKGMGGLINNSAVTPGTATTGDWLNPATTPEEIVADVNNAIVAQTNATLNTAIADTVLIPWTHWQKIAVRPFVAGDGTGSAATADTILTWLMKNNIYTATTKQPLTITPVRGLETAGVSNVARMVAYRRDPAVLKLHMPMPHRFLPVWQEGPMRWLVPGIFRLGGVDIRRPKEVSYIDGI